LEGRRQKEEEGSRSREWHNQRQRTKERRWKLEGKRMNEKEGNMSRKRREANGKSRREET
jgi:hypothetical protein